MIHSLGIQGQGSLTCFAWVQNGQYVFEKTTTCDQGWQLSRPYLNVQFWLALSVMAMEAILLVSLELFLLVYAEKARP